ncbi:integral membrane efflux protein [Streptomyces lincolnensis]|uniref:Integral membrane efflux protein n=1 Tax=Streptomyces lincolnensis TaxID=1915 RepID=A0A1B1M7I4_STRLN|nr:MFS transporter [Streptomyces lincolnensis]ANS64599.1 integral membrane efflux protein [Streptomyces lincolnensis]AXG57195.1 integral membrane efflux protein [Streptomyces lincolnensis]QMV06417.1 MFS transporter [Streptomyces lincolnensis]
MTTTLARPAGPDDRPAHRDPNVLRWLGAYSASAVGDNVYYIALSWAAVQAGTPTQAGLVTAVSAIPRALLMLGGGVLADRYGPRRVVLGSSAARCLLVVTAAGLLLATSPGLWALGAVAFLFGVVDAVFLPAAGALPTRITGRGQLARVQGMRGFATRLANVFGGPLGGLGVAVGGTAGAFGLAALLIGVSLPLLWAVRVGPLPPDDKARGAVLAELKDGLRHIGRDRVLRPLMIAIALVDLGFVGPMNLGLTLLAEERGWGSSGMGWMLAGFGTGAGAASLLLTLRGRVPRAGLVMAVAELGGGLAIAGLAQVTSVAAAAGMALVVGLLAGLGGALCGALVQAQAGPAYVGRVTAVSTLVGFGVAPLTFPLVGAAADRWGTGPVFASCAALCAVGSLLALCTRPLRRAELPR